MLLLLLLQYSIKLQFIRCAQCICSFQVWQGAQSSSIVHRFGQIHLFPLNFKNSRDQFLPYMLCVYGSSSLALCWFFNFSFSCNFFICFWLFRLFFFLFCRSAFAHIRYIVCIFFWCVCLAVYVVCVCVIFVLDSIPSSSCTRMHATMIYIWIWSRHLKGQTAASPQTNLYTFRLRTFLLDQMHWCHRRNLLAIERHLPVVAV